MKASVPAPQTRRPTRPYTRSDRAASSAARLGRGSSSSACDAADLRVMMAHREFLSSGLGGRTVC
eukprot:scaffold16220_cov34-Phaeocystis_antarctica.AAC.1